MFCRERGEGRELWGSGHWREEWGGDMGRFRMLAGVDFVRGKGKVGSGGDGRNCVLISR